MREPVRGPGRLRSEPAADLVFALRARLEKLESLFDAIVDTLVVAGLEVQSVVVAVAAPVTAVQRVGTLVEYGGRNRLGMHFGNDDEHIIRQRRTDA